MVEGRGNSYYGLVPDYSHNFLSTTENNMESVFEVQYSDANPSPAGDGDFEVNPNLGLHRAQFFAPPGIGWADGEMRPWIVDEFKKERNRDGAYDIRLKYTAFYSEMHNDFSNNTKIYNVTSNSGTWGQSNWTGRVFYRKYSSSDEHNTEDYYNPINVRVIRYADILLMYAECIAELDGSLSEAVGYVNRVRARANMPDLQVNHSEAASNKIAFLKRLQMERVLELATEGHRWADLIRWGLLETEEGIEELRSRDADFDNFDKDMHACLPIPSMEVNNNPNIEQNPNY
ncbi:MAG: RagB/SusD family nutrient uptake outer membrane protein [Bacteroides sp.]|nr:RagB/SusD family nutrient uptake outer membrane protein [Bacteroides sp.]